MRTLRKLALAILVIQIALFFAVALHVHHGADKTDDCGLCKIAYASFDLAKNVISVVGNSPFAIVEFAPFVSCSFDSQLVFSDRAPPAA